MSHLRIHMTPPTATRRGMQSHSPRRAAAISSGWSQIRRQSSSVHASPHPILVHAARPSTASIINHLHTHIALLISYLPDFGLSVTRRAYVCTRTLAWPAGDGSRTKLLGTLAIKVMSYLHLIHLHVGRYLSIIIGWETH